MVILCRLCLTKYSKDKMNNVFRSKIKHSEQTLVDFLFWVFSVEIDVTDPYPKDICYECLLLIEYVAEIRSMFQKKQESLKKDFYDKTHYELKVAPPDSSLDTLKQSKNEHSKERCTTSPNSPNIYSNKQSSPRVRVSLAALEALCPVSVNLEKLEESAEYMYYRQVKNGRFKRRKYRHFNLDQNLLDDICGTLDKKHGNSKVWSKDISTNLPMGTKAINTDESCMLYSTPLTLRSEKLPMIEEPIVTNNKKDCDNESNEPSVVDAIKTTTDITSSLAFPEVDKSYDCSKKDVSTNTTPISPSPTKSIGVNAKLDMVGNRALTKRFKRRKNMVSLDISLLDEFSPKVWLEPIEYLIGRERYKEINSSCYVKDDRVLESEQQPELDEYDSDCDENRLKVEIKKQRFLDYYNNFSSFAVRELIAGKKIRDSESDHRPIFKVSNVCNVFVCNFCSKSFLSQAVLNSHYKRTHKSVEDDSNKSSSKGSRKEQCGRSQKSLKEKELLPNREINHCNGRVPEVGNDTLEVNLTNNIETPAEVPVVEKLTFSEIKKQFGRPPEILKSKDPPSSINEVIDLIERIPEVDNKSLPEMNLTDCNKTLSRVPAIEKFVFNKIKKGPEYFKSNNISARKTELRPLNETKPEASNIALPEFNQNKNSAKRHAESYMTEHSSLGLRRKAGIINYNVSKMFKSKIFKKSHSPMKEKAKLKKRRKRNDKVTVRDTSLHTPYIWDRKGLGKYSAIAFYKNSTCEEKQTMTIDKECNIDKKQDTALNETIRKLADRLDEFVK